MCSEPTRSNPMFELEDAPRKRFMMVLSYNGAPFKGWQIQPHDPSVQESIEKALRIALKTPLHIVGAGRTDTEVNARFMTAHFDVPIEIGVEMNQNGRLQQVLKTLNALLRPSIAIYNIFEVPSTAHARFDALTRTYRYYVHTVPDPFKANSSRFLHQILDFDAMNAEAQSLIGTQDFTSFSKLHTDTNNNLCTVTYAKWHSYGQGHYYFEITANRFLRNMVRAIVGTLIDVGTGKEHGGHIEKVIKAMDRCSAGTSVPGFALYLWEITYPYPIPECPLPDNL